MSSPGTSRRLPTKVPLRGLFADGIWQCNCNPRLPAERFQTKNGGPNHGRWFYTCQKPAHKKCNFFLWEDDAKPREQAALMENSRTEPLTPGKNHSAVTYPDLRTSPTPGSRRTVKKDMTDDADYLDPFELSDDDLAKAADRVGMPPPPETPRKAVKSYSASSPGKRKHATSPTYSEGDEIFTTPSTGMRGHDLFAGRELLSPAETPTPSRFKDMLRDSNEAVSPSKPGPFEGVQVTELAREVLDRLRDVNVELNEKAITGVKYIGSRWSTKLRAAEKGRDVSRSIIKERDISITKLQARVESLEAERESNKATILYLRKQLGKSTDGTRPSTR